MCLIALALNADSRWPLVLAANRDEFHDRPSQPATWWADEPAIFGGRDLSAGGTWLGLSRGARLGAITNYREGGARPPAPHSRGTLLRSFLTSPHPSTLWAERQLADIDGFAGFNALLFDWSEGARAVSGWYLSNRHPDRPLHRLGSGIHGLSNHLLGTRWPKVERLCSALSDALARPGDPEQALLNALADAQPIGAAERDRADPAAGAEVLQRTPFIVDPRYGTRASTVVMLGSDGAVRFTERSWDWHQGGPRLSHERRLAEQLP
jgi:uncharacterized protein with NRDE domain